MDALMHIQTDGNEYLRFSIVQSASGGCITFLKILSDCVKFMSFEIKYKEGLGPGFTLVYFFVLAKCWFLDHI